MSGIGELERMVRDLGRDPGLEVRMREAMDRLLESGAASGDVEATALAARELGYDVTAEDAGRLVAEREEVDDGELGLDELAGVAGGFNTDEYCPVLSRLIPYNMDEYCRGLYKQMSRYYKCIRSFACSGGLYYCDQAHMQ